jgi:hypothetical protein
MNEAGNLTVIVERANQQQHDHPPWRQEQQRQDQLKDVESENLRHVSLLTMCAIQATA